MSGITTVGKNESFRDHIATVNAEGKRNWIYAQKPKGKLFNARAIVSLVYLILFFSLPFVRVHDDPFFLFNIMERRFIFFGVTFWPQDFFIFGIGMLVFILFIVLFTVAFGRVFCGWACPQTVFMEMVFRRIEYWIEGDAAHQKMLNRSPWNKEKILKKTFKHFIFFLVAFIIANTFLSYIIGTDKLFLMTKEPLMDNIGTFTSLLIFTGIFYGVYSWFREQVCLIVCPYGRLQGVMTDKNSILVAYDYLRGEPRGKFKKGAKADKGDCIDCNQCVNVCPTGIDIRNGTQLECINCTACIDACNFMMNKIGAPEGLIRMASENGIANKEKLKFTPRLMAYSSVLLLLVGFFVVLLSTRKDVDATVLRTPGMLFQKQENNMISNLYNIKLINKTHKDVPVELRLESGSGMIKMVGKQLMVGKESKAESGFFIYLPNEKIKKRKTELKIGVYSGGKKLETITTTFLGPITIKK
jgi:cytochrome c oxidase accessory protein FixG